jgi:hypothetical protein
MFGRSFYHSTLRKYVITFGNMFNGIYVQRFDQNNERIQTLKVPIAYGPKEKFLVRASQDPDLNQAVAISLPRIGFEMTGLSYAPGRKLPSLQKNVKTSATDANAYISQYRPVPYDIQFQMSIFVRNADDGTQIVEQILPYFQPEWTNNINLIPELNLVYDVPCILNDVSLEDSYQGDYETRRAIVYTLSFTMKGYIFGPISTSGFIKRTELNFISSSGFQDVLTAGESRTAVITPGLTAAGQPTSDPALSVDYRQIDSDDDYGFAKSINEY